MKYHWIDIYNKSIYDSEGIVVENDILGHVMDILDILELHFLWPDLLKL